MAVISKHSVLKECLTLFCFNPHRIIFSTNDVSILHTSYALNFAIQSKIGIIPFHME